MSNWHEYRKYRKIKNANGSYTYAITIGGEGVEVNEKIFKAYVSGCCKMEYMERELKRERVFQPADGGEPVVLPPREVSLDKLIGEDWEFPSAEPTPDAVAIKRSEIKALHRSLDLLDTGERELINALFFDGFSERGYSSKTGIPQKTINDRKCKILNKLKNILQIS